MMKPKDDFVMFDKIRKEPPVFPINVYSSESNIIGKINKSIEYIKTFIPNSFSFYDDFLSGSFLNNKVLLWGDD